MIPQKMNSVFVRLHEIKISKIIRKNIQFFFFEFENTIAVHKKTWIY